MSDPCVPRSTKFVLKIRAAHVLTRTTMVEFHPKMTEVERQGIIQSPVYFEDKLVVYQRSHLPKRQAMQRAQETQCPKKQKSLKYL
jgi:hypothetical protein